MDEKLDQLGQLADQADNLLQAMKMPLPPSIHLAALKSGLEEISAGIKDFVVETSGENPWED